MPEIELVVFDVAGTTVYDEDGVNHCVREALAAAGQSVEPAAVNRVTGIPKPQAIVMLVAAQERDGDLGHRIDEIHRDFVRRSIEFYRPDPREVPRLLGVPAATPEATSRR
jgi:phosphoglycolate phosphatase-like HAD superfamily hydrolase